MTLTAYIIAFIGGSLSLLAPCSLPILPAYFAALMRAEKRFIFLPTLFFGLGLALVFTLFGLLAGGIGSFLTMYRLLFSRIFGIVIILFGFMLIAGKKIPGLQIQYVPKATPTSMFLFGLIFGVSWSSCIGPVLGSILILVAAQGQILSGGVLLFIFALGLLTPLFILSYFLDRLGTDSRFWKFLKGREINITKNFSVHSTLAISGILLVILGLLFATGAGAYLVAGTTRWALWEFDLQQIVMKWFG